MAFKRNAAWVENGRPYVDALHASIIADPAQALAQFTAGHLG